jgi:hypothetical protein
VHGNVNRHSTGAPFQRTLADGAIDVLGFGAYYKDEVAPNWTFSNLVEPEDAEKNSPLTRHLPTIAQELGIKTFLVPSPVKFNGLMLPEESLTDHIRLRHGIVVKRNQYAPADGILLKPGQAYAVSTGGCAMLVGWRTDPKTYRLLRVGVAHAGLVSILNDVGGNLCAALGGEPEDLHFSIEFAISADVLTYTWDDPKWGRYNEALCSFIERHFGSSSVPGWYERLRRRNGHVSTAEMLRTQLKGLGVSSTRIQVGSPTGHDPQFYTTRDGSNKRNLFIVARYAN